MAAMDFRFSRDDRGPSVVWHILGTGAGTFALLALVLILADAGGEELPYDDEAEVLVQGGETVVVGRDNTEAGAEETDPTYTGDTVTVSGPTPEGDLSVEDVDVDVSAGELEGDALVDAQDEAVLNENMIPDTDGDASGDATADDGGLADEQEAVVVDPDGTTAPVVPTLSGPEGEDDNPLTQE